MTEVPQFIKPALRTPGSHKKSQFSLSVHYSKPQLSESALSPVPNLSINLTQLNSPTSEKRTSKLAPLSHRPSTQAKSPKNAKVVVPKKELQKEKTKSLIPFTDSISFARYMLYFPQEEVVEQVRRSSQTSRGSFPFKRLVDEGSAKMEETTSKELFSLFTNSSSLKKQLDFNKEQENLFRKTAEDKFFRSSTALNQLRKEKEEKVKHMPKIKVHPSIRFQDPKQFEHEVIVKDHDDDDKPSIVYPKYMRFVKFGEKDRYNFQWARAKESDFNTHKPNVTESSSFTIVGKYGYLYGGRSKELNNDISILDLTTWEWSQALNPVDHPPFGRFGHSANAYKRNMVIFGGVKSFNANLNFRECLNDVRSYDTVKNEWSYIKCIGDLVEPRRNHSSVVVGKHLVVYGGINSTGEYLYDLKALDLVTNKWITCKEADREEIGIAFHTACVVLYDQRKDVNLFKMSDFHSDGTVPAIKEEGIFFFGGKQWDDTITNSLKLLKIGQSVLRWTTPKTIGKPPEARYSHTMSHSKALNMLIIYGGRNDKGYTKGESPVFGDFHTLQLETLTWVRVTKFGSSGCPRGAHVAAVFGTTLIMFGGINFNVYCPAELNLIEMDQMIVNKQIKIQTVLNQQSQTTKTTEAHETVSSSPLEKLVPSMKIDDGGEEKYVGMLTFLPVPNQYKKEKPSPNSQRQSFNSYFNNARGSRRGTQIDLKIN